MDIKIRKLTPGLAETSIVAASSYGYMNAVLKRLGARQTR